jgi:hypothetical protein
VDSTCSGDPVTTANLADNNSLDWVTSTIVNRDNNWDHKLITDNVLDLQTHHLAQCDWYPSCLHERSNVVSIVMSAGVSAVDCPAFDIGVAGLDG